MFCNCYVFALHSTNRETFEFVFVFFEWPLIRCSCYNCRTIVSSLHKMHWVELIQDIVSRRAQSTTSTVYNDTFMSGAVDSARWYKKAKLEKIIELSFFLSFCFLSVFTSRISFRSVRGCFWYRPVLCYFGKPIFIVKLS